MRTLIHIGQHKTGTTSIQHYLKDNRVKLSQQGLYVAESIAGLDHPSHYILNIYALAKDRLSTMKEAFLKSDQQNALDRIYKELPTEIEKHYETAKEAGCTDIIWSNEGLYLLNSESEYEKLISLFKNYTNEIVCICCFRELESYKRSYKRQLEKTGISSCDDPDSYRYTQDDSWLFDYSKKRQLLSSSFDNLIFINYTQERMVERFMQYIGYPVGSCSADIPRLNITPE